MSFLSVQCMSSCQSCDWKFKKNQLQICRYVNWNALGPRHSLSFHVSFFCNFVVAFLLGYVCVSIYFPRLFLLKKLINGAKLYFWVQQQRAIILRGFGLSSKSFDHGMLPSLLFQQKGIAFVHENIDIGWVGHRWAWCNIFWEK